MRTAKRRLNGHCPSFDDDDSTPSILKNRVPSQRDPVLSTYSLGGPDRYVRSKRGPMTQIE